MIEPYEHPSWVNPRTILVDEIIARVQHHHIIRVCGTPASGKTTVMQLIANKLLEKYGQTTQIYTMTSWDEKIVRAIGWNAHLERETGVRGDQWPSYRAYLLLDEAQQSYWDNKLWAVFFKRLAAWEGIPFVILFSSYGLPGRGFTGYGEKYIPTPMVFDAGQQISLQSDEHIEDYHSTFLPFWKPVGLLLDEDEAIDIMTRHIFAASQLSLLSADLKKQLFLFSDGHVGLLTSLVRVLENVPVRIPL